MSWWRAKYKNDHGEYEITFGSKYYERAKAVEKVCQAVIDKAVKTKDDIAVVTHGRWVALGQRTYGGGKSYTHYCSECGQHGFDDYKRCPNCGAKMDGGA